jgi:hypothetical protein
MRLAPVVDWLHLPRIQKIDLEDKNMATELFDPYFKWLAIPPEEQPPHHYRLLGVPLFTADADVIENAANQRMSHLRTILAGDRVPLAQKLLNEVANARVCLLHPDRKAKYDATLRQQLPSDAAPPEPPPMPVESFPAASSQHASTTNFDVATRLPSRRKKSANGIINLIAHIIAPIAGLTCGYLLICQISPRNDFLGIFRKSMNASATDVQETKVVTTTEHEPQPPPATSETKPAPKISQPMLPLTPAPQVAKTNAPSEKIAINEAKNVTSVKPENSTGIVTGAPNSQTATSEAERTAKLSVILSEQATAKTSDDFKRLASALLALLNTAPVVERNELLKTHQDRLLLFARKSQDEQLTNEVTRIILGISAAKTSTEPEPLAKTSGDLESKLPGNNAEELRDVEPVGVVTYQRKVSANTSMPTSVKSLPASANTGISVKKGRQVVIRASGTWKIGAYKQHVVGAEKLSIGLGKSGQAPVLIKTGSKETTFVAEQEGVLFLGIIDPHVHDNDGDLTVEISVLNK